MMSTKDKNGTVIFDVESFDTEDTNLDTYLKLILQEVRYLSNRMDSLEETTSKELDSLSSKVDELRTETLPTMKVEVAKLQLKAGLLGLLAGLVPVLIAIAIKFL